MSLQEEELRREERRLSATLARIEREIERAGLAAGGRKEQLVGGKRELWEGLVFDTDDWFEAAVQLTQQAQELSQHATSYRLAQGRGEQLERALSTPYFARFDFREAGAAADEAIYIGTMSIADEVTHEVVVYDWRAPVAGMYYDFGPGPASYRAPDGEVRGEMTLKRQFVIRGGKLLAAFDTGVTIGDEMLQRMLGGHADEKMKSIVTTIQREQNRVIRETDHRYVFVQGAAGSGKTSAALQRVAYLLYKYRQTWEAEQLVLFSPNDVFNDYVSNVLPELGEDAIPQTTFYDYVWRRLRHAGDVEHPYDQLEVLLSAGGREDEPSLRREGIRAKSSLSFAEAIDAYAKTLGERGAAFRPLLRGQKVVVEAAELERMFYVEFAKLRPPLRLAAMKERLLERLKELEGKRAVALYRKWIKEPTYLGTEQELKRLGLAKARKAYAPVREQASTFAFVDVTETYLRMLRAFAASGERPEGAAVGWDELLRDTEARLRPAAADDADDDTASPSAASERRIPYEDAVPMLYLLEALHGASRMNRIRHVVVDEAQDYTPLQWAYLRRLFPNAGFTAVGDANQAIHGVESEEGHLSSLPLFPREETVVIRLKKSYRSTRQIVAFAAAMLPGAEDVEPFERDGPPPELVVAPEGFGPDDYAELAAERIRALQADGYASIAVIGKTAAESEEAHRRLGALGIAAARIRKETTSFPAGIVVLPSYLAKGLEFDAVIVWDAGREAYGREEERKLLYTVCTRALHRLVLLARGAPSPLFDKIHDFDTPARGSSVL
ncbi:RNA polymerase recycling motor HelD [Paenibacillus sp.]|uniref:RNA polymerase recycling motor HelD n=1 Tax=Paenibacillus sp. TaxID=58172 RepID=UPI002D3D9555|nr:RNA polymerase recycling motor HelD [Paenibacillus sp.]HZG56561.1 RNA polymerase recycling motor HelD [Paenibacillus sp.]